MFTEDLAVLFADFGVTATFGSLSAQVVHDMPGQSILGDMQITDDYSITYASTDLAGLNRGSVVTVDGIVYTVREKPLHLDDGRLLKAALKR